MFNILKCYYKYGIESIDPRKPERLQKAFTAYNDLATLYPSSHYMPEANMMKAKSQKELSLLGEKNQKKPTSINKN
jgi:outer membrane protein assembly factor BamD (BamD/ComL family)